MSDGFVFVGAAHCACAPKCFGTQVRPPDLGIQGRSVRFRVMKQMLKKFQHDIVGNP
jgi:hypothetical protein